MAAFPWPEADDFDYSILDEAEKMLPSHFKVVVVMGKIFNLAWWLMGFNAYAYALADQKPGEYNHQSIANRDADITWLVDKIAWLFEKARVAMPPCEIVAG